MQKKPFQTVLFSTAGVLIVAVILIAFNIITGAARKRADLTAEKAFTLSDGTRAILRKLDTPVTIRFYCTQTATPTPHSVFLKSYAKKVEDLLMEYKDAAGGNLVIEKLDPQPDTDVEDTARFEGVEPQELPGGDTFYLGIVVSLLDQKVPMPFLSPERERELEYDLSRAITRVVAPERVVIGVMSSLPVWGQANPMMMQMGQQGQPPWVLINELKKDFTLKRVGMDAEKIDDDVKVLLVIHPTGISDAAQFAIDQFVLRGGKLIAFLDPQSLVDSAGQNPMQAMQSAGSTMERLLKAWGLEFDSGRVVADRTFKFDLQDDPSQRPPGWLILPPEAMNTNDITTSGLETIWFMGGGAFTGTPVEGLKQTVLLKSSKDSQLIESFVAKLSPETAMKEFKPSGVEYSLALRLAGKFRTAFPDGKPGAAASDPSAESRPDAGANNWLRESKDENVVVLVGDADMVFDQVALQPVRTPFGTFYQPRNGNLSFAQNSVEQVSGDQNLIAVRSRTVLDRPFTRIRAIEAKAEAELLAKIQELQENREATIQRIQELRQQKNPNQKVIRSPEEEAEIEALEKKEAEIARELRRVQKDLRREVVSLQRQIQWWNILAMPVAVSLTGIVLAIYKRKRTSAK